MPALLAELDVGEFVSAWVRGGRNTSLQRVVLGQVNFESSVGAVVDDTSISGVVASLLEPDTS